MRGSSPYFIALGIEAVIGRSGRLRDAPAKRLTNGKSFLRWQTLPAARPIKADSPTVGNAQIITIRDFYFFLNSHQSFKFCEIL